MLRTVAERLERFRLIREDVVPGHLDPSSRRGFFCGDDLHRGRFTGSVVSLYNHVTQIRIMINNESKYLRAQKLRQVELQTTESVLPEVCSTPF